MAHTVTVGRPVVDDLGPTPEVWYPAIWTWPFDPDAVIDAERSLLDGVGATRAILHPPTDSTFGDTHDLFEFLEKIGEEMTPAVPGDLTTAGRVFGRALYAGCKVVLIPFLSWPSWLQFYDNTKLAPWSETILEDAIYQIVKKLYEFDFDRSKLTISCFNEPEGTNYFDGSQEEMFRSFAAVSHGAKRAQAELGEPVTVGGMEFSGAYVRSTDLGNLAPAISVLRQWIQWSARPPMSVWGGARVEIDEITVHLFGESDPDGDVLAVVQSWLIEAGYGPRPVVLTESNLRVGGTQHNLRARRAAFIARQHLGSSGSGVTRYMWSTVPRQSISDPLGFSGDNGLHATVGATSKTAAFFAQQLLGMHKERRVQVTVDEDARYEWDVVAGASASADGTRMLLCITRFGTQYNLNAVNSDSYRTLLKYMTDLGYRVAPERAFSDLHAFDGLLNVAGITYSEGKLYIAGSASLPAYLPAQVATDLAQGKAYAIAAAAALGVDKTVSIDFPLASSIIEWHRWDIHDGSAVNNPEIAYEGVWSAAVAPVNILKVENFGFSKVTTTAPHGVSNGQVIRVDGTGVFDTSGNFGDTVLDGKRFTAASVTSTTIDLVASGGQTSGAVGTITRQSGSHAAGLAAVAAAQTLTETGSGDGTNFPASIVMKDHQFTVFDITLPSPFFGGGGPAWRHPDLLLRTRSTSLRSLDDRKIARWNDRTIGEMKGGTRTTWRTPKKPIPTSEDS